MVATKASSNNVTTVLQLFEPSYFVVMFTPEQVRIRLSRCAQKWLTGFQ